MRYTKRALVSMGRVAYRLGGIKAVLELAVKTKHDIPCPACDEGRELPWQALWLPKHGLNADVHTIEGAVPSWGWVCSACAGLKLVAWKTASQCLVQERPLGVIRTRQDRRPP